MTKSIKSTNSLKSLFSRFVTPSERSRKGQVKANAQLAPKTASKALSIASDDTFWSAPASVATTGRYNPKGIASGLTKNNLKAPALAQPSAKEHVASWLSSQAAPAAKAQTKAHADAVAYAKTPGNWGGELELGVMAKLYGRAIRVFEHIYTGAHSNGASVQVKPGRTINAEAGNPINVVYDGIHYDSLTQLHDLGGGTYTAQLTKVPGDGDCMLHAVAHAADLPMSRMVEGMHSTGQLWIVRQHNKTFRAMFDDIDSLTDDQVLSQFRKMVVAQMRHDIGSELAKPAYAEAAHLAALAYAGE